MTRLFSAVSAALLVAGAGTAAAQTTATHTLVKLQPGDAPPADSTARISAAANEIEAFQAVVSGGTAGLKGVSMKMSDLVGPATIPASEVMLYRAAYMDVRNLSDANGRKGRTPDALIPDVDRYFGEKRNAFPFDVPAGENRTVWVDVHVPPGTPAGNYQGTLEVTSAAGDVERVAVELEVFPFELPSTPHYRSSYGLSWNATCKAHHGDVWCSGNEAQYDQLRVLYGIAGLDNRMTFSGVAGATVPGSNGNLDFSRYDRVYGPLLDGTAPTRLPGAKLTSIEVWQTNPKAADYTTWASHFRDKGWFDVLFDYTCDEPPLTCAWSDIKPQQDAVHAGDPAMQSLVTTTVAHLKDHGLYESTDIIVPVVNFVEGKSGDYAGDQSSAYRQAAADGKTVWIYSSCMSHGCGGSVGGEYEDPALKGWPSVAIDHTALQNRALPWVAYRFGFSGELYWDSAYAFVTKSDPWVDQWDFTGNGDGTLLYPGKPSKIGGTTDIPVESVRMKQIRDGIEDYEYLKQLEKYDAAAARRFAEQLFPHAWSAGDIAPEELLAARHAIADEIAKHVVPVKAPPSKPVTGSQPQPTFELPARADVSIPGDLLPTSGRRGSRGCSSTGAAPTALAPLAVAALAALRRRRRR